MSRSQRGAHERRGPAVYPGKSGDLKERHGKKGCFAFVHHPSLFQVSSFIFHSSGSFLRSQFSFFRSPFSGFKFPVSGCFIIAHTKIPAGFRAENVSVIPHDAEAFARALYAELHRCDAAGAKLIVVEAPPDLPEWSGIADRLRRAAA